MTVTLIVQDNDGSIEDANAYVEVDAFKAYHDNRGNDYSSYEADSDAKIKQAIIEATNYVDIRFNYCGHRFLGRDQTTQFPRYNLYDRDGFIVSDIPREVKNATMEYAWIWLTTGKLAPIPEISATGGKVISSDVQVDTIREKYTYETGGAYRYPEYPVADKILKSSGFVISQSTVSRG